MAQKVLSYSNSQLTIQFTTTNYAATQNMYPVSADTGYKSCIPSRILLINQANIL